MRKNELEFLEKIQENTEMGMHTVNDIIPIVTDQSFKSILDEQLADYKKIHDECVSLIVSDGEEMKSHGKIAKIMSTANIKISTLLDKTPSHISEMMITGSTMGINQITKELNEKGNCVDEKIKELADKLLHIEQKNIDTLRTYL